MFKIAFEKRAPLKKNYLRATHSKFVSIDISNLTYYNKFWNTVKPVASSKTNSKNIINLGKSIKFIKGEEELAKTFSEDFVSILKNLGFNKTDVESIIVKFQNNPSIVTLHNYIIVLTKIVHSALKKIVKTELIKENNSGH